MLYFDLFCLQCSGSPYAMPCSRWVLYSMAEERCEMGKASWSCSFIARVQLYIQFVCLPSRPHRVPHRVAIPY